jgi:hypothetical protein
MLMLSFLEQLVPVGEEVLGHDVEAFFSIAAGSSGGRGPGA